MVEINEWDEANQLKWLKVRLTARAQTAFQRLSAETKAGTVDALKERFEPASSLSGRAPDTKKSENWADLAEDLQFQADKAYPQTRLTPT